MSYLPLARYPVLQTSHVDEFEHRLRTLYGATGFTLSDPSALDARANFLSLEDVALGASGVGTAATVDFDATDFALLQLPLRGSGVTKSGGHAVSIDAGNPCLTSAGRPTTLERGQGFEQLFLRVNSSALRRRLELLLDAPVRNEIEFEPADFAGPREFAGLRRMIGALVTQLDDEEALFSPMALREMQQAVIVQLLFASRHNFSGQLETEPQDTALAQLRRVQAYIEANWNKPIVIDDLVAVAGGSARSLYRGFERAFGCPPMIFAKRVRLRHARQLLTAPDGATTVSGVALACGFSNLGHFASDYRTAFGELPSKTLRRARMR